jgi:hypothetical protein
MGCTLNWRQLNGRQEGTANFDNAFDGASLIGMVIIIPAFFPN